MSSAFTEMPRSKKVKSWTRKRNWIKLLSNPFIFLTEEQSDDHWKRILPVHCYCILACDVLLFVWQRWILTESNGRTAGAAEIRKLMIWWPPKPLLLSSIFDFDKQRTRQVERADISISIDAGYRNKIFNTCPAAEQHSISERQLHMHERTNRFVT